MLQLIGGTSIAALELVVKRIETALYCSVEITLRTLLFLSFKFFVGSEHILNDSLD